jgi:hypothetical protein
MCIVLRRECGAPRLRLRLFALEWADGVRDARPRRSCDVADDAPDSGTW